MEQTTTIVETESPKRPTFLKVICILSFIGAPLGLIGGIMNYFTYTAMANAGKILSGVEGTERMEATMNTMKQMLGIDYTKVANGQLIVGLLNILVLVGAIMMWNLKKMGFYIYTLGQLATLGIIFGYIGGMVGGIMGIFTAIFAIAFIVMYGVNLKHMK